MGASAPIAIFAGGKHRRIFTSSISIESSTREDEIEVQIETLALTATQFYTGYVKAKTGDDIMDTVYQDWYKAIYLPIAEKD